MTLKHVIKRNGKLVDYDRSKIYNAIAGASKAVNDSLSAANIEKITSLVEETVASQENVNVEQIQDIVEKKLMEQGFFEVAKRYIMYRQHHTDRRMAQKHLMQSYRDIFFADAIDSDLKRDNANINTDASMGIMLKLGTEGAKNYLNHYVLPEKFKEMHMKHIEHLHELHRGLAG